MEIKTDGSDGSLVLIKQGAEAVSLYFIIHHCVSIKISCNMSDLFLSFSFGETSSMRVFCIIYKLVIICTTVSTNVHLMASSC